MGSGGGLAQVVLALVVFFLLVASSDWDAPCPLTWETQLRKGEIEVAALNESGMRLLAWALFGERRVPV